MHGMDLSSWLQLFYDNIIFKMTAALFQQQNTCDYVGRETEKLLALRERCMDDGQAYAAYAAQCLGISSLARCVRDLYKSISTSSDAFLTINDDIEVHLQLPPILQNPANLPKTVDIETELDPHDPVFLSGGGFAGSARKTKTKMEKAALMIDCGASSRANSALKSGVGPRVLICSPGRRCSCCTIASTKHRLGADKHRATTVPPVSLCPAVK